MQYNTHQLNAPCIVHRASWSAPLGHTRSDYTPVPCSRYLNHESRQLHAREGDKTRRLREFTSETMPLIIPEVQPWTVHLYKYTGHVRSERHMTRLAATIIDLPLPPSPAPFFPQRTTPRACHCGCWLITHTYACLLADWRKNLLHRCRCSQKTTIGTVAYTCYSMPEPSAG